MKVDRWSIIVAFLDRHSERGIGGYVLGYVDGKACVSAHIVAVHGLTVWTADGGSYELGEYAKPDYDVRLEGALVSWTLDVGAVVHTVGAL